jgi:hypothetical protein
VRHFSGQPSQGCIASPISASLSRHLNSCRRRAFDNDEARLGLRIRCKGMGHLVDRKTQVISYGAPKSKKPPHLGSIMSA